MAKTAKKQELIYVGLVYPHEVPSLWPYAARFIEMADEKVHFENKADLKEVLPGLLDGTKQLWILHRGQEMIGAGVTEIHQYPKKKICRVVALGSEPNTMPEWFAQWSRITEWARAQRCEGFEIIGRRGWVRRTASLGFSERAVILYADLEPEDEQPAQE
jgi:hypothetical protein